MPQYSFSAKNTETGELRSGVAEAKNERALFLQLRAEGFFLIEHAEKQEGFFSEKESRWNRLFGGVSLKEKVLFARNLSIMVSSGVQLSKAIQILSLQAKSKRFQKVLKEVSDRLQTGVSLGDSFAKYPSVFSELFVSMVRVGEIGGSLEEVLKIVAVQLEKEQAIVSKVRGAMIYPTVILVAMTGVGILMLTYILPKITSVFEGMDVELPATTRFIISLSEFLRNNALVSLGIGIGCLALFLFFLRTTAGKKTISFLTLRAPGIKEIAIKTNSARFARIYSSLLRSGVPVVDALKIISETLSNWYCREAVVKSVSDVQKGVNLSESLASSSAFPPLVAQIVEVGETTGKTEEVLLKLAEFYEEDVDQITKNISSIVEPVLMIVIGLGVGFFAVAMLTPMYSVMENIK